MKMPWAGPSAGLHRPKTRQWVVRFLGSLLLMTLLAGCAMFATGPLDVLTYEEPTGDQTHRKLFVFMRGMGGSHRSFEEEGLVAGVRARGLPFDNIYLGYGLEDPYVGGQQLLATILPKDRVNTFDGGGHDYYTFKTLWNLFLDSGRYNRPISSGDGNTNH
ncbi:MAG: hypothetical protein C4519_16960 [Desulfobacteraceae bacterium]|nr:MAG: hypothetical protein C4519_16960 [Desulfobacteraceae bacterium]